LEHAASLEHDVNLVILVRLLAIGLRSDEHVHTQLKARGRVNDLVAAAPFGEALGYAGDVECVRGHQGRAGCFDVRFHLFSSRDAVSPSPSPTPPQSASGHHSIAVAGNPHTREGASVAAAATLALAALPARRRPAQAKSRNSSTCGLS